MQLARVEGSATATVKHASMRGCKLLLVQPLMADGASPDGDPLLAVDALGAGRAELVVVTNDGLAAREALEDDTTPVRWTVIGIVDG